MSSNIVLNESGIIALLQSKEMQKGLVAEGKRIQSRCGKGYETEKQAVIGRKRAIVRVSAVTAAAKRDNSKNNTLLKALGGK